VRQTSRELENKISLITPVTTHRLFPSVNSRSFLSRDVRQENGADVQEAARNYASRAMQFESSGRTTLMNQRLGLRAPVAMCEVGVW